MPKDPNEKEQKRIAAHNAKIRSAISKLAKRKLKLLKDKFRTDDAYLRALWDQEIKNIDIKMMELQAKLKQEKK